MLLRLIILFTLLPLVELWLLLWLSSQISLILTIALVLVTGVIGAALARRQGWRVLREIQTQTSRGEVPAGILIDGLMILIAGALLITPGILTDIMGFALLFPPFRALLKARASVWIKQRASVHIQTIRMRGGNQTQSTVDDDVIDVDFTRMPADSPPNERPTDRPLH